MTLYVYVCVCLFINQAKNSEVNSFKIETLKFSKIIINSSLDAWIYNRKGAYIYI